MKRTKMFLGATTCCLSIAAVAATRIQINFSQSTRYYCTSSTVNAKCIPYALGTCEYNGTSLTCYYYTSPAKPATSRKYILYTNLGNPFSPTCGQSANCKTKLTYDICTP